MNMFTPFGWVVLVIEDGYRNCLFKDRQTATVERRLSVGRKGESRVTVVLQAGTRKLSSAILSLKWFHLAIYRVISMLEGCSSSTVRLC